FNRKNISSRAFAWSVNDREGLHGEHGYISVRPNTKEAALTTVMDNGFVTIEEGPINGNTIKFRLKDVGRISFSRDLPVHDVSSNFMFLSTFHFVNNMRLLQTYA
ncbi:hypothetical protein OESDEN_03680, partial [Oesophagostomum dentatum]